MTASRNKASRAVTAALVGVLSVGAVPMVAVAAESGATPLFVSPSGAFSGAEVESATFVQGLDTDVFVKKDGVWTVEYARNKAVSLTFVTVDIIGDNSETAEFTIDTVNDNDYTVAYYERDTKTDEPTGEALTGDIVDAGSYVAVVTAVSGDYAGGVIYVPFDITAKSINLDKVVVENPTYNAESKNDEITFYDADGNELLVGQDIEVTWYVAGHDTSDAWKVDEVKDAGSYVAVITGIGNYTGTVTTSDSFDVKIEQLDLSKCIFPQVKSDSSTEPTVPEYVLIDGRLYGPDSAIISELKAELVTVSGQQTWFNNGSYNYVVKAADPDDTNIKGENNLYACKYSQLVGWEYDGEVLENYQEIYVDTDGGFDPSKVVATDAKGNEYTLKSKDIVLSNVYDSDGNDVSSENWENQVGTYTVIFDYIDNSTYDLGGNIVLTVHVYKDVVDADASAAVSYGGKVVTSIEKTYDGKDLLNKDESDLSVTVKDDNGNTLNQGTDYQVTYYDANGNRVSEIKNAGTYTLKVTSDTYKLIGTTEMTITVSPVTIGSVTSDKLETKSWDYAGVSGIVYLPWVEGGYGISPTGTVEGLWLYYLDASGQPVYLVTSGLTTDVVKVTITNADGDVVDTIADEGVYTISFEARNSDAENNYVMPGDLTVECIKESHLYYADVWYTDYYADSVAYVTDKGFMNGYKGSNDVWLGIFGATNKITRADVACVLYNMATQSDLVETEPVYNELFGYDTGFDDCDGNAYYAKAVAWAKSVGVVNGYDDDTFGPTDAVTREQFACMLANYEQVFGYYETADTSVLDSFSDADETSSYAEDNLAWAVSEGVLRGNLEGELNPTDSIIRADVAVMIARYAGYVD